VSYYPEPKQILNILLYPGHTNKKHQAASDISWLLLLTHTLVMLLLFSVSLMSATTFAIMLVNHAVLSYSAGAVSLGYSAQNNDTEDANDKKSMTIYTLTFLLAGILPFIYWKILAPSIVAVYAPLIIYSFIAVATYIHFTPRPNEPANNLLDSFKGFLKTKIFPKSISLISMNKSRASIKRKKEKKINNPTPRPRGSTDFGSGVVGDSTATAVATQIAGDSQKQEIKPE
jgi:hypothetical protein